MLAAARFLLDTFAPTRCAACDAAAATAVCAACRDAIAALSAPPARRGRAGIAAAAFEFDGPVRAVLHRGKFRGNREALRVLSTLAAPRLLGQSLCRPDVVVPVPLGAARRRERGYNQAEVVAAQLAEAAAAPLIDGLRRVRETPPQADLDEAARHGNVAGAFAWAGPHVAERDVWVVDDVLTTGATTGEAAAVVRAAGAARVDVAVLALVR